MPSPRMQNKTTTFIDMQNSPRMPSARTEMPKMLNPVPIVDIKYCFPGRSMKSKTGGTSATNSPRSPSSRSSGTPRQSAASRDDKLREVFRHIDGNGDGKVSAPELLAFFESIGECMSCQEAAAVIAEADSDGDNMLCFEDFVRLMQSDGGGGGRVKEEEEDLRRAFEMFESDKGSGQITPVGLQRMLQKLGDDKSYDECVAMIQAFDIDGNGVLDFQDFQRLMMA